MYFAWTLKTVASIMSELPEVEWLTTLPRLLGLAWILLWNCFDRWLFRKAYLDGVYLPGEHKTCLGWIQQESTFWRRNLGKKWVALLLVILV
jgi:hypothetical protein